MMLYLGLGLSNAPSFATAPIAYYDDFGGSAATINARALSGGASGAGKTWTITPYSGANTSSLQPDGSGKLSGGLGGTGANTSFGHVTLDTADQSWVTRELALASAVATSSSVLTLDHMTLTSSFAGLEFSGTIVSGAQTVPRLYRVSAGTATSIATLANFCTVVNGDTLQHRYFTEGGAYKIQVILNGRELGVPVNLTSAAPTLAITHKHGFRGNIPASSVERFEAGDPNVHGMLSLRASGRVIQRNSDGSIEPFVLGDFSKNTPIRVDYKVDKASDGTSVAAWQSAASYSASGVTMRFSGVMGSIASPPATGFITTIRRNDGVNGAVAYSRGPVQYSGEVILVTGQSLGVYLYGSSAVAGTGGAGTLAAPTAPAFVYGANLEGATYYGGSDVRNLMHTPIPANGALAVFTNTLRTLLGETVPLTIIGGGRGGTGAADRLPGSDNFTFEASGVEFAGADFATAVLVAGQREAILTDVEVDAFAANCDTIFAAHEATIGRSLKVIVVPLTAVWGASDARCERMRKAMWTMCQGSSRYVWGSHLLDLQINPADRPHFTDASPYPKAEQARRLAYDFAKMKGVVSEARDGPAIISVTRDSATQCTVLFDLNGADGLEIANSGYAGDFRGGLRFATDSAFASQIVPTNGVVGTPSAGQCTVVYTFGANSIPGTVYVSGPYGSNPFNRANDATIDADMAARASMLRGTRSGEASVAVQPYFQASGGDYVSDS